MVGPGHLFPMLAPSLQMSVLAPNGPPRRCGSICWQRNNCPSALRPLHIPHLRGAGEGTLCTSLGRPLTSLSWSPSLSCPLGPLAVVPHKVLLPCGLCPFTSASRALCSLVESRGCQAGCPSSQRLREEWRIPSLNHYSEQERVDLHEDHLSVS